MAEVFEAELVGDHGFVRKVAIKRMLDGAASDPSSAHRFLDEARIASRLHHANIVSVVDLGLLDNLPFQVLELVDGINAQQLVQRAGGTLPVDVALAITAEVAHGLDHAHSALDAGGLPLGIVHRDVKPANVLVSWGGDVKLSDFGIAFARDRAALTEAGLVPGTSGFIAPEQRLKSEMDGRTDVFALGLTLHSFLTGYTPLQDVTVEIAILEGEPMPLDAKLPDDVRVLIARAVTPSRLDRLTAAQFADAIGGLLAPRLMRDARSLLRGYLGALDKKPAARVGALDQLLGIEVVLSDAGDDGVRRFATVAAPTLRAEPAGQRVPVRAKSPVPGTGSPSSEAPTRLARSSSGDPGGAGRESEEGTTDVDAAARPRSRRAWVLALASSAVLATGGVVAWRVTRTEASSATGDAAGSAGATGSATANGSATGDAAVSAGATGSATTDAAPSDAPQPTIDAVAVDPPRGRRDAGVATKPRRDVAPPVAAGSATTAVQTGVGYLQVTGEANIGARVIVDGKPAGFAPNKIEVSLGHHRVEITRQDGTRLPAKEVEITTFHSLGKPARATW